MHHRVAMRLVAMVVLAATAASCSKSSQTTTEAFGTNQAPTSNKKQNTVAGFCQAIEASREDLMTSTEGPVAGPELFLTGLKRVQKSATKEVGPILDRLVKIMGRTGGLEGSELEDRMRQIASDPDFQEAVDDFDGYVSRECDIELGAKGTATTGDTDPAGTSAAANQVAEKALADLKAYLNTNYGNTGWIGKLSGLKVSVLTAKRVADFTVGSKAGISLTPEEAVAACSAVAEFIDRDFSDGKSVVTDSNGTTVASRNNKSEQCKPA